MAQSARLSRTLRKGYARAAMKWSDEYSTGVERIDNQHKMLFRMSEDFRTSLDDGLGDRIYDGLLKSLDMYARSHFRLEENCMASCECPAAKENSGAHRRFMETLREFQDRYSADGFAPGEARELVDYIDRWLSDHIGRIDVQLKPFAAQFKG